MAERNRRLSPLLLLGVLALALLWSAAPSHATPTCGAFGPPTSPASCSLAEIDPESCIALDPIVSGRPPCGIVRLENLAYASYADVHGFEYGDPRITDAGQLEIAGILWNSIQTIALNEGEPNQDAGDLETLQWYQTAVHGYQQQAAQFAIDEYHRW